MKHLNLKRECIFPKTEKSSLKLRKYTKEKKRKNTQRVYRKHFVFKNEEKYISIYINISRSLFPFDIQNIWDIFCDNIILQF